MNIRRRLLVGSTWLVLIATGVPLAARSDDPASNVPIERFQKVDDRLYRGAQPTEDGFRRLRELGVRTIINLRMAVDAKKLNEQRIVESLGMQYVNIPIEDGNFFSRSRRIPDDAVRAFFKVVDSAESGAIFVHCHRGADRTGALVGFYRIARQGWDNARALKEAEELGMRSWYKELRRQISEFTVTLLQPLKTG